MKQYINSDLHKTKQWLFLMTLSVLLLVFVFSYHHYANSSTIMSLHTLSDSQKNDLFSDKSQSDSLMDKNQLILLCNGLPVPYDTVSNTYFLSQNMNTPIWQGSLSLNSSDFHLHMADDALFSDKSEAIRSGHAFTVYVMNKVEYQALSLVFTGLPFVNMTTEKSVEQNYSKEDIDNYVFNSETRYYGDITIFNTAPNTEKYQTLSTGLCYHERGATSSIYEKKNYSLKLLEEDGTKDRQALLGMKKSGEWKLISMFTDRSKIRDMTSLQLWKEMAEKETDFNEHGAEMAYCEVILDGVYLGLYGMLYPIDEETLSLKQNDSLFKILGSPPPTVDAFQYSMDNNYNVAYPIRMRYPKEYDSVLPHWAPMKNYLTYAYWTPDANIFSQLIDLRNAADFYIFLQATAASDNQLKNTYMVSRYLEDIGMHRTYIIPWDLNYSFGDCYKYDPNILYTAFNNDATVIYIESGLKQIFDENIAGARTVLNYKWAQHRQNTLHTEHIKELMQQNMDLLVNSGAFSREKKIWPEVGNTSDLSQIFDYVDKRMIFLDEYFNQYKE